MGGGGGETYTDRQRQADRETGRRTDRKTETERHREIVVCWLFNVPAIG